MAKGIRALASAPIVEWTDEERQLANKGRDDIRAGKGVPHEQVVASLDDVVNDQAERYWQMHERNRQERRAERKTRRALRDRRRRQRQARRAQR